MIIQGDLADKIDKIQKRNRPYDLNGSVVRSVSFLTLPGARHGLVPTMIIIAYPDMTLSESYLHGLLSAVDVSYYYYGLTFCYNAKIE